MTTKQEVSAASHLLRYCRDFAPGLYPAARGSYVYDGDGRAILDFASGQMCATLGHNHPAVTAAIRAALDEPMHLNSRMIAPAVVELAEALCALLPDTLQKVMFLSTGAESNEAALRMAKLKTGGFEVLAMGSAWHGQTAGAQASTYAGARRGYGPSVPGTMALPPPDAYRCPIAHCRDRCDMTCLKVGFEMADTQSVGSYAAMLCEPILAAGGVVVPPEGYLARLKELCAERGMLLILDEAQTGLGRTGWMFFFERDGVTPDILALSKTLGGGFPLSATITSAEIEEEIHRRGFHFYTSHVSDPLPARVGLAVINLLVEEDFAPRARELGDYFMAGLRELGERYEAIGHVRGSGLLVGVEIVSDRERRTADPELGAALIRRTFELGMYSTLSGAARDPKKATAWKLAPPLTVTRAEIDQGLAIIAQALRELRG